MILLAGLIDRTKLKKLKIEFITSRNDTVIVVAGRTPSPGHLVREVAALCRLLDALVRGRKNGKANIKLEIFISSTVTQDILFATVRKQKDPGLGNRNPGRLPPIRGRVR